MYFSSSTMCLRTVPLQSSWQSTPRCYSFSHVSYLYLQEKALHSCFSFALLVFQYLYGSSRFCKSLLKTGQNKLFTKPYTNFQKKDWKRPVWSLYLQNDLANQRREYQLLDGCCCGIFVIFPLTFGSFSGVCFWYNWIPSVHKCKEKKVLLLVPWG